MKLFPFLLSAVFFVIATAGRGEVDDSSRSPVAKNEEKVFSSRKSLSLVLKLNDGSVLKGIPSMDEIPVQTSFANVKIPMQSILAVEFPKDQETIKIRLRNGDQLQGITKLENIQIQALFGKIEVSIKHVVSISVQGVGESSLSPNLLKGLVLYYSFDQDEGEKVTDQSGENHQGTVHGAAFASDGKIGGAYEFNGRDSYISVPNSKDFGLDLDKEKTFSMWWKAGSLQKQQQHISLISKRIHQNQDHGLSFCILNGSEYYLALKIDHWITFAVSLSVGEWNHMALTKKNHVWKVYHNGQELSVSRNMGWPFNEDVEENVPLFFGRDPIVQDAHFEGLMDEIRVYDRALSEEEIRELYQKEKTSE